MKFISYFWGDRYINQKTFLTTVSKKVGLIDADICFFLSKNLALLETLGRQKERSLGPL